MQHIANTIANENKNFFMSSPFLKVSKERYSLCTVHDNKIFQKDKYIRIIYHTLNKIKNYYIKMSPLNFWIHGKSKKVIFSLNLFGSYELITYFCKK
jgi:hypothetical protein